MDNATMAGLLKETADLMEIDGADGFRVRSYRNAADAVEQTTVDLVAVSGDVAQLLAIQGIGFRNDDSCRASFDRKRIDLVAVDRLFTVADHAIGSGSATEIQGQRIHSQNHQAFVALSPPHQDQYHRKKTEERECPHEDSGYNRAV